MTIARFRLSFACMKQRPNEPGHVRDTIPFEAPPGWQPNQPQALRGRGAAENPEGRFERLYYVEDLEEKELANCDEQLEEQTARPSSPARASTDFSTSIPASPTAIPIPTAKPKGPRTQFLRDASKSVLTRNQSPDVGFNVGLNPYRGCEHGCVYCYARPTHEFLGMSAGLDFESKILVKEDAPELLQRELSKRNYRPESIGMSGVTDCYQPIERKLEITRRCLAVLADSRNPVGMITKNALVMRDLDHLRELAAHDAVVVHLSITTLDPALHRVMEPRTSPPQQRLRAVAALAEAGIPVGALIGPVIPGLTDHEIPAILEAAANAGASFAGHIMLRLPGAVEQLFVAWLERHFPDRRDKVLARLRSMRDGELNDTRFNSRMRGDGVFAEQIRALFEISRKRVGLNTESQPLSTASFRRPSGPQLRLF